MGAENKAAVPSVKLPRAVQMQAENANKLLKEQVEKKFKEETPPEPTAAKPALQAEPESKPTVVPEVKIEPEKTPEELAKYWEHRFKTSRGMDEAEKARLKTENSDLRTKYGALERTVRDLEDKLNAVERQGPVQIDLKKYLTEEQIDTYGPETLQSIVKVATHAAEEAAERRLKTEIERRIRPVEEKLQSADSEILSAKEEKFWQILETKVPQWALINDDQKFHEWLALRDPFTGVTRQNLLIQAQKALDPDRVVAVFEAFKQSSPAPKAPVVDTQQRVVPDPVGQTGIVTQQVPEAPFVKTSEILRFYDDCKLGRYRHRPQDKEAFEKKIREAQLAGRIIRDTEVR